MASNNHKLTVIIGAALSSGFNSVISGSSSKLKRIGGVIKDLEKQSSVSGSAIETLKNKYNSLLGSMNSQQAILARRENYKSQIMDIAALGASLAAPVNSAMKFESAMADVKKVVDFSSEDGLQKMGNSLKELSRTIPLTVEGLAQIAAAGGQLGVKENDLIGFTTNVAKMSTAFDMLPDEAGKSMATLSNVFNIPINSLSKLGDAINHISNNNASTARNIVSALARAGGAARQFGLSSEKTVALVGTLIAMGKAPEEAGTATAAILQRLQLADKLGPKAEAAFRKIGISAKVFGKMINEDAQGALTKFFSAVENLQGQDRAGVLVDIFGKNYSGTVATLVGSLDKYRQQLLLIANQESYLGSMEKEFLTRSATTANALQLLKNNISELSIAIGDSLIPSVNTLFQSIGSVLKTVTSWIAANPELTKTITHVVGGLIAMKLATFTLGYASTFLFGGINKLVMIFKGLRLGLSLISVAFKSFFVWPIAIAGIALTVYKNWDEVKQFLQNIWTVVEPYWIQFKSIMDSFGVTDFVISAWTQVQTFLYSLWNSVSIKFDQFIQKISNVRIVDEFIKTWGKLKSFFISIFDSIQKKWDNFTSKFKNIFSFSGFKLPKIGNLFASDNSNQKGFRSLLSDKVANIRSSASVPTRNQNNNFNITINGTKNDDAESISNKVMSKVSGFSKTFLYDEVVEVA